MQQLLDFLNRLEAARIHYRLEHVRDDTVMVVALTPACWWEVEFFADGTLEIERFRSAGEIETEADVLDELIADGA